jgi:hypothetical protein
MSRNANGDYTLPLSDVVNGTAITATWANTTLNDIATALTDSLDRYGRGGLSSPLENVDGTLLAPGIGFANEASTGIRRSGTNEMRAVIAGADVARWRDDSGTASGSQRPFQPHDGTDWYDPINPASAGAKTFGTITARAASTVGDTLTVTAGGLNIDADGMTITGDSNVTGNLSATSLQAFPYDYFFAGVTNAGFKMADYNIYSTEKFATGSYRVRLAITDSTPFSLQFCAIATPHAGAGTLKAYVDYSVTWVVEVYITNAAGTLVDAPFSIFGVFT